MSKKQLLNPYRGWRKYAREQVAHIESWYGVDFTPEVRKAICKRLEVAFIFGTEQAQRAERARRQGQTANATTARVKDAAAWHRAIAADFRRRSKTVGVESRLAATAKKMRTHINTVRTAVKRYP